MVLRPQRGTILESIQCISTYIQGSLNFCRYLHTPHALVQLSIDSLSSLAATGLCGNRRCVDRQQNNKNCYHSVIHT